MPFCVVVLAEDETANLLKERLQEASIPLAGCQLVRPQNPSKKNNSSSNEDPLVDFKANTSSLKPVDAEDVQLLNPKIAKQMRQRNMALWLMPFGFISGITFSQMTGLTTFSDFGLGSFSEPLISGLVGMSSGLIGSYVATASVNTEKTDDLLSLLKLNQEGKWLLILETPMEIEIPWNVVQEVKPLEVLRLRDI